jgi:hypothetical protein
MLIGYEAVWSRSPESSGNDHGSKFTLLHVKLRPEDRLEQDCLDPRLMHALDILHAPVWVQSQREAAKKLTFAKSRE